MKTMQLRERTALRRVRWVCYQAVYESLSPCLQLIKMPPNICVVLYKDSAFIDRHIIFNPCNIPLR